MPFTGSAVLAGSLVTTLTPKTQNLAEQNRQQYENRVNDLSDSHDSTREEVRRQGQLHQEAEEARRLVAGEHQAPSIRILPR